MLRSPWSNIERGSGDNKRFDFVVTNEYTIQSFFLFTMSVPIYLMYLVLELRNNNSVVVRVRRDLCLSLILSISNGMEIH